MTALVEHVISPRVPDEIFRLLVEEHLRRIFEVLLLGKHLPDPLLAPEAVKLHRPVRGILFPPQPVAREIPRRCRLARRNETAKTHRLAKQPQTAVKICYKNRASPYPTEEEPLTN